MQVVTVVYAGNNAEDKFMGADYVRARKYKGRPYMSTNGHGGRILYTLYARFTCLRVDFRNNSTAPKTFALSDLASKENLSAAAPKTFVPWEQCRRQKTCSY